MSATREALRHGRQSRCHAPRDVLMGRGATYGLLFPATEAREPGEQPMQARGVRHRCRGQLVAPSRDRESGHWQLTWVTGPIFLPDMHIPHSQHARRQLS